MAMWAGWIAALGGLLVVLNELVSMGSWAGWVGGLAAIIFGIWATMK